MRVAATLRFLIGPIELLHEHAGPRLLRLARAGVATLWLVKLLLDPLWRLAQLPTELLDPPGLLRLLPKETLGWLFSEQGLTMLWVFAVFSLAWSIFGATSLRYAIVGTISALLVTIYASVIRSFGPAVHTDIVLVLALYVFAAFAWADVLAPGATPAERQRRAAYPLVTLVAILCLPYSMVGFNRLLVGGVHVFTGDTMEVWAIDAGLRGYFFDTGLGWQVPQWPLVVTMLRLGLPVITLFEMTAPLCLALPHYRWLFIPVMLSFHLLSLVLMNIFFFDDMLLYLLLVDWSRGKIIPYPQRPRRGRG